MCILRKEKYISSIRLHTFIKRGKHTYHHVMCMGGVYAAYMEPS